MNMMKTRLDQILGGIKLKLSSVIHGDSFKH